MNAEDARIVRRSLTYLLHEAAKNLPPDEAVELGNSHRYAMKALARLEVAADRERKIVLTYLHNLQQGDLITLEEKSALFAVMVAIRNGEHISGGGK